MLRHLVPALFAIAAASLVGCTSSKPTAFSNKKDEDDHSHDRAGMMLEDIDLPGIKCHVGLTAHLEKEPGKNELDVVFETVKDPKPVPIAMTAKVTARVTRAGDKEPKTLTFAPADKSERKDDPDGKCSRFSAPAPWMNPEDKLDVVLTVEVEGQVKKATWSEFSPKKYEHKHDAH